jgi:hypothetical protein
VYATCSNLAQPNGTTGQSISYSLKDFSNEGDDGVPHWETPEWPQPPAGIEEMQPKTQ